MAATMPPHGAHWRAAAWFAALAGLTVMASPPEAGWLTGMDQGLTRALGADRFVCDTAVASAATNVEASRTYLVVHWLADVLAGWLFAAGWRDLARALLPREARTKP